MIYWFENLNAFEYCSKEGYIKIQIAWVSNTKEENNHLVLKTCPVCTKIHITFVFFLHGFSGGYWAGYRIQWVCIVQYLQGLCTALGPTGLLREQRTLQLRPLCTASSPVSARVWNIHPAFKTSNPTCHKLSLQAFMADSKHTLIREQLHPASSANGAALLIKSALIREPNKNKGYTTRSPPFYLCSIQTHDFN